VVHLGRVRVEAYVHEGLPAGGNADRAAAGERKRHALGVHGGHDGEVESGGARAVVAARMCLVWLAVPTISRLKD
jgi:hypothetical protein